MIQDLRPVGVPGAFGLGFAGLSGLGAEYRGQRRRSSLNNVSSEYMVLGINAAVGVELTDRLSVRRRADAGQRLRATRLHRPVG